MAAALPTELELIVEGGFARVVMTKATKKAFDKLPTAPNAALLRVMRIYSDEGPDFLTPVQFEEEGRHPVGGHLPPQRLRAFKEWGVRVYGAELHLWGGRTFICTALDPAKKRDKADAQLVKRAAKALAPYVKKET